MSEPIVLGIESTCDETAAAIVQGRTLRSNVVASSMEEHARYGGVIPEMASPDVSPWAFQVPKRLPGRRTSRCTASIMSSGISPSRSCNSGRFLRIRWR